MKALPYAIGAAALVALVACSPPTRDFPGSGGAGVGGGGAGAGNGGGGNNQGGSMGNPLTITAPTLAAGWFNIPYAAPTFSAAGGSGKGYSFAVSAGSLPGGLTLATSGVISGRPSKEGDASFTVEVTDSEKNTASVKASLTIGRKRYIAYSSNEDNPLRPAVYLVDIANNSRIKTTLSSPKGDGSVVQALSFSPDGTHLAFRACSEGGADFDLWVVDLTKAPVALQVNSVNDDVIDHAWSPDSSTLAFLSNGSSGSTRVILSHLESGSPQNDPPLMDKASPNAPTNIHWVAADRLVWETGSAAWQSVRKGSAFGTATSPASYTHIVQTFPLSSRLIGSGSGSLVVQDFGQNWVEQHMDPNLDILTYSFDAGFLGYDAGICPTCEPTLTIERTHPAPLATDPPLVKIDYAQYVWGKETERLGVLTPNGISVGDLGAKTPSVSATSQAFDTPERLAFGNHDQWLGLITSSGVHVGAWAGTQTTFALANEALPKNASIYQYAFAPDDAYVAYEGEQEAVGTVEIWQTLFDDKTGKLLTRRNLTPDFNAFPLTNALQGGQVYASLLNWTTDGAFVLFVGVTQSVGGYQGQALFGVDTTVANSSPFILSNTVNAACDSTSPACVTIDSLVVQP